MTTSFGANVSGSVAGAGSGSALGAVAGVVGAAVGIASAIGSLIPAMIICVDEPLAAGIVNLDFNPKEITISRSFQPASMPRSSAARGDATGGSSGPIMRKSDTPQIRIGEIWLEGLTCKLRCDQLMRWLSPVTGIAGQALAQRGMSSRSQPPPLRFIWGPPKVGFFYKVMLTQVTITYERFNPIGIPVRAKVGLTMQQIPDLLSEMPTNPTSGGPAGRRTHVMRAGDSLQSVATTYYGSPGHWREIAAANRVDDPARVRPGTTVYLPIGADLEAATGR